MINQVMLLSCWIVFVNVWTVFAAQLILHANNPRAHQNHEIREIQTASKGKTVLIRTGKTFSINFCMRIKTEVKLMNLRFSHGNHSAMFSVNLDHGKWMGTYYAPPGNGYEHFRDTGMFPNTYEFESGWHVLKVNISETSSPIALDFVEFNITDDRMTPEVLSCEIICIPTADFPSKDPEKTSTSPPAIMRQESKPTECAEIDNVDIPLFHSDVRKFTITSTLPKYKSFNNRRDFNLTNCPHLSPVLWRFQNFRITEQSNQMSEKDVFLLTAPGQGMGTNSMLLVAIFKLEGQSKGSIDAKIGSELYLRFKHLPSTVGVSVRYRGQTGRMVELQRKMYNGTALEHRWDIPDFTWTEEYDNYIIFSIDSDVRINFEVDNVRLVKRPMLPETTKTIYKSDDVVIEAVFVEMWWLAPDFMTVKLANGEITEKVAYMRFYRPIPWNDGYAQVFVLYHDGNSRLLPVAPEGLDWIPFGTSVILGQTLSNSIRPYLYINEVHIDPERWEMSLHYKDGGSLKLKLDATYSETTAIISDINFAMDSTTRPFATIRSMYVKEGNTDMDSVKVDNSRSYSVMDKWGEVPGKSFVFFRRCISKHLTLSPDIQVDIVEGRQRIGSAARRSFTREVNRIPTGLSQSSLFRPLTISRNSPLQMPNRHTRNRNLRPHFSLVRSPFTRSNQRLTPVRTSRLVIRNGQTTVNKQAVLSDIARWLRK